MRWLADECVAAELVSQLRAAGHDVDYVAETAPRARDVEILERAHTDIRLLLTVDKDFGDLVFKQSRRAPGVVLLRIDPAHAEMRWERLRAAIDQFGEELFGRYTVVEEARVRSRRLPGED